MIIPFITYFQKCTISTVDNAHITIAMVVPYLYTIITSITVNLEVMMLYFVQCKHTVCFEIYVLLKVGFGIFDYFIG